MVCCKRINHDYYKFKYDVLVLRSHHALASFVHGCVKSKKFLRRPLNSSVVLVSCCIFHGTRRVLPPTNAEEEEACVVHDTQLSLPEPKDVQRERKENRTFQGESTERAIGTLFDKGSVLLSPPCFSLHGLQDSVVSASSSSR